MAGRLKIDEINRLTGDAFVARFGGVFEHSPWVAEAAWGQRPWRSLGELHAAMCGVVRKAGPDRHLTLIRAHPDLVGRAALAGTLSRSSTAEQAAAGLDPGRLSPSDVDRFAEANAAYQARFGFPFVICARENTKDAILTGFARRLPNPLAEEIATALEEIEKIAWYRLADLVAPAAENAVESPGPAARPTVPRSS